MGLGKLLMFPIESTETDLDTNIQFHNGWDKQCESGQKET